MATTARVKVGDDPPSNLAFGVANGVPGPLDGSGLLPSGQVPSGGAPGGSAGGDLTGTYPNPTVRKINGVSLAVLTTGLLKNTTLTGAPSIATAADVPTVAAGGTGPLSATDSSVTNSRAPNGSASGDLAGTYPSPTVGKLNGTSLAGLATGVLKNTTGTGVPSIAAAADIPTVAAGSTGPLTATDPSVNKVSSKAAATSVTNTVTLTTMATFTTIPAANITTNTAIRLDAHGTIDSGASTGNFNMQIKVNGTLVATVTCAAAQTAGATGLTWNFNGQLYVDATGVSGSLMWLGTRMQRTAAGALNPTPDQGTATTVDISGGATVTLVASMGSANASNVFRLAHALAVQV